MAAVIRYYPSTWLAAGNNQLHQQQPWMITRRLGTKLPPNRPIGDAVISLLTCTKPSISANVAFDAKWC